MSYTPNMEAMQLASKLVSNMISMVKTYEAGQVTIGGELEYELTPQQVNDLKVAFASARAACIAALNSVTG
jgi:hypothetical protein